MEATNKNAIHTTTNAKFEFNQNHHNMLGNEPLGIELANSMQ